MALTMMQEPTCEGSWVLGTESALWTQVNLLCLHGLYLLEPLESDFFLKEKKQVYFGLQV